MADDTMTFRLEGREYRVDDFELGELEWLETELDMPFDQVAELAASGSIRAIVRFIYLIKKRDSPGFTLNDARKLKLAIFNEDDDQASDGETAAAKKRPTKAAKSG